MENDRFLAFASESRGQVPAGIDNVVLVRSTTSTNALARRSCDTLIAEELAVRPSLFLAFEQTEGRGRRGNSWLSLPGCGVYATLLFPLPEAARVESLPLLVAVGLCEGINQVLGAARCGLKWPNDLVVEGRKLGGILIELVSAAGERFAVIGFGVNHSPGGAGPVMATAVSLAELMAAPPSLASCAQRLAAAVVAQLAAVADLGAAVERYRAHSVHRLGQTLRCRWREGTVEGEFRGLDAHGFLLLATESGELRLSAGEILEHG